MTRLMLLLILFLAGNIEAHAFSLFGNPSLNRILGNLGHIELENNQRAGIVKNLEQAQCEEAVEKARSEQGVDVYGAAYLLRPISKHVLNLDNDFHTKPIAQFGGAFNLGVSTQEELIPNSYNARFAPHLKAGCLKHTVITRRELIEFDGQSCLALSLAVGEASSYQMIYCPGATEIYSLFI